MHFALEFHSHIVAERVLAMIECAPDTSVSQRQRKTLRQNTFPLSVGFIRTIVRLCASSFRLVAGSRQKIKLRRKSGEFVSIVENAANQSSAVLFLCSDKMINWQIRGNIHVCWSTANVENNKSFNKFF